MQQNSIMKNSIFFLILTFFGSSLAKREIVVGKIFRSHFCQSGIFHSTLKKFPRQRPIHPVSEANEFSFFFQCDIFGKSNFVLCVCCSHSHLPLGATHSNFIVTRTEKKENFSNAARCWVMKIFFFLLFSLNLFSVIIAVIVWERKQTSASCFFLLFYFTFHASNLFRFPTQQYLQATVPYYFFFSLTSSTITFQCEK